MKLMIVHELAVEQEVAFLYDSVVGHEDDHQVPWDDVESEDFHTLQEHVASLNADETDDDAAADDRA